MSKIPSLNGEFGSKFMVIYFIEISMIQNLESDILKIL
ncbi:hypothetical protein LEP1GSC170_4228 [Leptospira interrogans serovar Bataviae str. HAI135]|nr:hypothetical protein LEP1GSC170_4228 [Leptospira interrogans serovar Bataviae str. HAI135]